METKNEPIPKEIVAVTAAEPEAPLDWGVKVADYNSITTISLEQRCLLCDNTRVLPAYMSNIGTYVCDECREAMAYIKEVKKWRGDSLLHG